jgi:hypothetical protein
LMDITKDGFKREFIPYKDIKFPNMPWIKLYIKWLYYEFNKIIKLKSIW